jgi:hypothetical protein
LRAVDHCDRQAADDRRRNGDGRKADRLVHGHVALRRNCLRNSRRAAVRRVDATSLAQHGAQASRFDVFTLTPSLHVRTIDRRINQFCSERSRGAAFDV